MNSLLIDMDLTFQAPIHITGDSRKLGVDKASAKSAQGPYSIPATSLKGHLRSKAEVLLRTWGLDVCHSPEPSEMCLDSSGFCLICRTFGNPRQRSPLMFSDALPQSLDVVSQNRGGVSISRLRRTSLEQRLFFVETLSSDPAIKWNASITGHFQTHRAAQEAAALIYLAAKSSPALGGGKSRGLGQIASWKMNVSIDSKPVTENDLKPIWQSWTEGKE